MAGYQRYGFYTRDNEHLVGGIYRTLTGRQDAFDWGNLTDDTGAGGRPNGLLARPKAKKKTGGSIVMPDEKDLPEGWSVSTVRGLMDHEMAAAIFGQLDVNTVEEPPFTRALSYILDEGRIQGSMTRRFPGSADNFDAMNLTGLDLLREKASKINEAAAAVPKEEQKDMDVLGPLIKGINAKLMSPTCDMKEFYKGHPWADDLAYTIDAIAPEIAESKKSYTMSDSVRLAKKIVEKLKLLDEPDPPEEGGGEGEGEGSGDTGAVPAMKKALAEDKGKEEDGEGGASAPEGMDVGASIADEMLDDISEASDKAKEIMYKEMEKDLKDPKKSGMIKPLYNLDLHAARTQDVEQHQYKDPVKLAKCRAPYKEMREKIARYIAPLRAALRIKLLSEARTKYRFEQDAGDLCKKSLYQVAQGTSDRVFQTMRSGKSKKTIVSILIDSSGSMGSASMGDLARWTPGKGDGRDFEKAFHAAMTGCALAEALRGMPGIKVEVSSFTAYGRLMDVSKPSDRYLLLQHIIHKSMDNNESSAIASMLLSQPRSENVDGESVRWAGRRLLSKPADRRILIVLSDGYPSGGVATSDTGSKGVCADLRSAVKACEANGIETIGIGIKTDAVHHFYPKHIYINDTSELMGKALRELLDALDGKEKKR